MFKKSAHHSGWWVSNVSKTRTRANTQTTTTGAKTQIMSLRTRTENMDNTASSVPNQTAALQCKFLLKISEISSHWNPDVNVIFATLTHKNYIAHAYCTCIYDSVAHLQSFQGDKVVKAASLNRVKLVLDQMPTTYVYVKQDAKLTQNHLLENRLT